MFSRRLATLASHGSCTRRRARRTALRATRRSTRSHPLQGQSPYSASKIGADKLAESYHLSFGLPVTTLRPFNTYGPRQSLRAVIPTIIAQALAGDEVRLGSLAPRRDLTFVSDTAQAFIAVAEHETTIGQTLNAGSGKAISIGELAELIISTMGSDAVIVADPDRVRPERSEVDELLCDASALADQTGWRPSVRLSKGIALTVDWFRERFATAEAAPLQRLDVRMNRIPLCHVPDDLRRRRCGRNLQGVCRRELRVAARARPGSLTDSTR